MMGGCTKWCEMRQKNKMQTNALLGGEFMVFFDVKFLIFFGCLIYSISTGMVTLALGGIYIGSSIFNIHLRLQGWTSGQSDGMILLVVNLFYVGTIIGSFISAFLVDCIEKLTLSVSTFFAF